MNKKFILAGLLGVFALTSCVDTEESDSVANVRNAQAAKLNAMAKLSEAQAAAEGINANANATLAAADAKYKEAMAEREKANAKVAEAQAAYQAALAASVKVQDEIAKAQADKQNELLDAQIQQQLAAAQQAVINAEKAKDAAELAKVQNENTILVLQNQMELAKIQHEIDMSKAMTNLEKQKLQEEIDAITAGSSLVSEITKAENDYNAAVLAVTSAKTALYNQQVNYITTYKYEPDFTYTKLQDAVNTEISVKDNNINSLNASNNGLKETLNWLKETKGTVDEADSKIEAKLAELATLQKDAKALNDAYQKAAKDAKGLATSDPMKAAQKKVAEAQAAIVNLDKAPGVYYNITATVGNKKNQDGTDAVTKYEYKKVLVESFIPQVATINVSPVKPTSAIDLTAAIKLQDTNIEAADKKVKTAETNAENNQKLVDNLMSLLNANIGKDSIEVVNKYLTDKAGIKVAEAKWNELDNLVMGTGQTMVSEKLKVAFATVKSEADAKSADKKTFNDAIDAAKKDAQAAKEAKATLVALESYVKDSKALNDALTNAVEAQNKLYTDAYQKELDAFIPSYDNALAQAEVKTTANAIFAFSTKTEKYDTITVGGKDQVILTYQETAVTSKEYKGQKYNLTAADLQANIESVESSIKNNDKSIETNKKDIEDLKKKLETAKNKDSEIAALGDQLKVAAEENIAAQELKIDILQADADAKKAILENLLELAAGE